MISLSSKSFVNIIFYEAGNDKSLREDDSPFISLFTIGFTWVLEKCSVKLCNTCSVTKFQDIN